MKRGRGRHPIRPTLWSGLRSVCGLGWLALAVALGAQTVARTELRVRDPFIWADAASQTYFLYKSDGLRVQVYTSPDLERWSGPTVVFDRPADFWADGRLWAPEMHCHAGRYYLFATFTSSKLLPEQWRNWPKRQERSTQVLVGDSPRGPFRPLAPEPTLPRDMMTLDGTLWVEDGQPWIVYCHEWVQIKVGTIEAMALSPDLAKAEGEPVVMIQANDAPWSRHSGDGSQVTDGPWLHRLPSGKLLMLWSSFSPDGYAVGQALSDSGKLAGPWRHLPKPLYGKNGGHPMLFQRFDGQLMLALHQPNGAPRERAQFLRVRETADGLELCDP